MSSFHSLFIMLRFSPHYPGAVFRLIIGTYQGKWVSFLKISQNHGYCLFCYCLFCSFFWYRWYSISFPNIGDHICVLDVLKLWLHVTICFLGHSNNSRRTWQWRTQEGVIKDFEDIDVNVWNYLSDHFLTCNVWNKTLEALVINGLKTSTSARLKINLKQQY